MIKWIVLLLGVSGLLVPIFLIILLIQKIFGVRFMNMNCHNSSKEKKCLIDILNIIFTSVSSIATAITACFIFNQIKVAKEATIPNLLVSMYNDTNRMGLYVTNSGKGHAIIDSIQIETEKGPEKFEIVTDKVWGSVLKKAGIDVDVKCFARSTIQKNIVAEPGSINILLGIQQDKWNELKENQRAFEEMINNQKINEINKLVLQHISNSNKMINGKEIVEKFDIFVLEKMNNKLDDESEYCQKIIESNHKEIVRKLNTIKVTIFYHSIIDDKPIESKQLQFLTTNE